VKKHEATVLVVDDDEWLAGQYRKSLVAEGFSVQIVTNALAAIDAVDAHKPGAIILDLFMPGPNGIVLIHELRSHNDLANIPIILCTNSANDLPSDMENYGVKVVLDKTTMHPDDIVAAVKKVLL
jgi:CheY-like chemotaxis protein